MPNVRKEGKKSISAWIYEDDKAALQKFARERGVPLSDLLDELIKDNVVDDDHMNAINIAIRLHPDASI
jgi:hypothetical protein